MVLLVIWSVFLGQNRRPYIRSALYQDDRQIPENADTKNTGGKMGEENWKPLPSRQMCPNQQMSFLAKVQIDFLEVLDQFLKKKKFGYPRPAWRKMAFRSNPLFLKWPCFLTSLYPQLGDRSQKCDHANLGYRIVISIWCHLPSSFSVLTPRARIIGPTSSKEDFDSNAIQFNWPSEVSKSAEWKKRDRILRH